MKQGLITNKNGDKHWYKDGILHREDGPAVEFATGTKAWFENGRMHRTDGPACENSNGDKYWYVHGEIFTDKQKFDIKIKELKSKLVEIDSEQKDVYEQVNTNSIICSFVDLVKNSDNKFMNFYYGNDNAGSVMVYVDVEKQTGETKARYEIYMKHVGDGYISVGFETENNVSDIQLKDTASLLIRMSDMSEHYDRVLMDIRGYMADVVKWSKEIISIMMQEVKIRKV